MTQTRGGHAGAQIAAHAGHSPTLPVKDFTYNWIDPWRSTQRRSRLARPDGRCYASFIDSLFRGTSMRIRSGRRLTVSLMGVALWAVGCGSQAVTVGCRSVNGFTFPYVVREYLQSEVFVVLV